MLNKIEFLPLRSLDVGGILQREPGLDSSVTHIRMEHVWRKAERNLERPEEARRPLSDQSNDRSLPGNKGKQGQRVSANIWWQD